MLNASLLHYLPLFSSGFSPPSPLLPWSQPCRALCFFFRIQTGVTQYSTVPSAGELDMHAAGEGVGDALARQLHVHVASIGSIHTEEAAKEVYVHDGYILDVGRKRAVHRPGLDCPARRRVQRRVEAAPPRPSAPSCKQACRRPSGSPRLTFRACCPPW